MPPPRTSSRSTQLSRSWEANAEAWSRAVRAHAIASRRLATDEAILRAVREREPGRVLDVGCGEGWLVRALAREGIDAVGIDASPRLIELARVAGGGRFEVCSYAELVASPERLGDAFPAVVFNFSLFEEELAPLLRAVRGRLAPGGVLLVQTVHPWSDAGRGSYRDGWRVETFAGFEGFREPMPWYFRTLGSWVELLRRSGYVVEEVREPAHPDTHEPLSLLMAAVPAA